VRLLWAFDFDEKVAIRPLEKCGYAEAEESRVSLT